MLVTRNLRTSIEKENMRKLKLRVIMPDKTRLSWKQGRVPQITFFSLNFSYLTYIPSKHPVLLYFDYFSVY